MSVTVESLELEVRASSHAAVSGLDALSASLTRLKTAAHGGLGLRAVTAQLGSLNGALGALNGTGKLAGLADSLQKLSACGNLKLSSTVATQIQNIGAAVRTLDGTNFGALTSLAGSACSPFVPRSRESEQLYFSAAAAAPGDSGTECRGPCGDRRADPGACRRPCAPFGDGKEQSDLLRHPAPAAAGGGGGAAFGGSRRLAARIRRWRAPLHPSGAQMQSIAAGLSALPGRLTRLIRQTDGLSAASRAGGDSGKTAGVLQRKGGEELRQSRGEARSCVYGDTAAQRSYRLLYLEVERVYRGGEPVPGLHGRICGGSPGVRRKGQRGHGHRPCRMDEKSGLADGDHQGLRRRQATELT